MKKALIFLSFLGFFTLGVGNTSNAARDETCVTEVFDCGDGRGSLGLVCGSSTEEMEKAEDEMLEVICG